MTWIFLIGVAVSFVALYQSGILSSAIGQTRELKKDSIAIREKFETATRLAKIKNGSKVDIIR